MIFRKRKVVVQETEDAGFYFHDGIDLLEFASNQFEYASLLYEEKGYVVPMEMADYLSNGILSLLESFNDKFS